MACIDKTWQPGADRRGLSEGEVHVWRVEMSSERANAATAACLSPDERERLAKYKFEKDQRRYLTARSTLRHVLGGYLGLAPADIDFMYGEQGKPRLAARHRDADIHFNISHSGDVTLLAFCKGHDVGVDVERMRDRVDFEAIASRHYTEAENQLLKCYPHQADRRRAFFHTWARKEAIAKGLGEGVYATLEDVAVSYADDDTEATLENVGERLDVRGWCVFRLPLSPDYAAAIACARKPEKIALFDA